MSSYPPGLPGIPPSLDDKVLSDWNGLMISALAYAGQIFDKPEWIQAASDAFGFICDRMMVEGRLYHSYRSERVGALATAGDYAHMMSAALCLYQVLDEPPYLERAEAWAEILSAHYWDDERGGYYFVSDDARDVIVRMKSAVDDAMPSANSVMVSNLTALFVFTGKESYRDQAWRIVSVFSKTARHNLFAYTSLFSSSMMLSSPIHIVLSGSDAERMQTFLATVNEASLPGVLVNRLKEGVELPQSSPLAGKVAQDDTVTAYICVGEMCLAPVRDVEALREALDLVRVTFGDGV